MTMILLRFLRKEKILLLINSIQALILFKKGQFMNDINYIITSRFYINVNTPPISDPAKASRINT